MCARFACPKLAQMVRRKAGGHISRRRLLRDFGTAAVALCSKPSRAEWWCSEVAPSPTAHPLPVRLDSNENPYGPSDLVLAAMRESLPRAHRYPEAADALQQSIAAHHRVDAEQVVLGCGSTEVLLMAADAFLGPGRKLILAAPTYPFLASQARQRGAAVVEVPLTPDRSHDLEAMLARVDASTSLVYICNPNNPTGTVTVRHEVDEFLRLLPPDIPVVMDEAYSHYVAPTSSYASYLDRPGPDHRTIVTRTFSAVYGLAGLRMGYAVAPAPIAKLLAAFRLQLGENIVAVLAALAALDDTEHVRQSVRRNTDDRQRFFNRANVRYAAPSQSQTNFVLLELDHPIEQVMAHFRANSILIGPRFPQLDKFVRVSIGRPDEMDAFWKVWDMLPHQNRHLLQHM